MCMRTYGGFGGMGPHFCFFELSIDKLSFKTPLSPTAKILKNILTDNSPFLTVFHTRTQNKHNLFYFLYEFLINIFILKIALPESTSVWIFNEIFYTVASVWYLI